MNKTLVSKHEYRSKSNPDRDPYIVNVYSDGSMSCNCRGWTMKKVGKPRGCTHTKKVTKQLGDTIPEAPEQIVGELVHAKLPVMRPNDGTLEHMWSDETIAQYKYDGTYALMIKEGKDIIMTGRSFLSDYSTNHPEFVKDAQSIPFDIILCGELVFLDEHGDDHFLTALATEETWLDSNYDPEKHKRPKLVLTPRYMVFDILKYGNLDLTDYPQDARETFLDRLFRKYHFDNFERVVSFYTDEDKQQLWAMSKEGIIIKRLDATIKDGKTNEWRRVKKVKTADFWCVGLTKGKGWREPFFGAMMLANKLEDGTYEYITSASGFNNEQMEHFLKTLVRKDDLQVKNPTKKMMYLVEPILVEIKYQRKTRTGALIMPRFIRVRDDITG